MSIGERGGAVAGPPMRMGFAIRGPSEWTLQLRRIKLRTLVLAAMSILGFALASLPFTPAGANEPNEAAFLNRYCVDCHGPDEQEGDRRFDDLIPAETQTPTRDTVEQRERWREVLDRLNLGDMPPEGAEPQPTDEQRIAMIERLTDRLSKKIEGDDSNADTVALRRLNREEYDHSVRELLGLQEMLAEPTASFPPDETEDGFATVAGKLIVSDFLMTKYLAAADQYLAAAIEQAGHNVPAKKWSLNAPFMAIYDEPDGADRDGEYQHIKEQPSDNGGYVWLKEFREAPASGFYRIRIRASATNREYPYQFDIVNVPKQDSLVLSVVAANAADSKKPQTKHPAEKTLVTFTVADDDPQWYEATTWIDKGYLLKLGYPNGPSRIKYMRHRLMRTHREHFPRFISRFVHVFHDMHPDYDKVQGPIQAEAFLAQQERLKEAGKPYDTFGVVHSVHTPTAWTKFYDEYAGPRVRVFHVDVEGPLPRAPEQTSPTVAALVDETVTDQQAIESIRQLASRAAGRPADDNDLRLFEELYRQARTTQSVQESVRLAYKSILCSPRFLYHRTGAGTLDDYELARRLAYFLTRQPPDERLLVLAETGQLGDPSVLREEAARLMNGPGFRRFVAAFADAWLHLSKLGRMQPDIVEHPAYFHERLEQAMRDETVLFLDEAIAKDRPIRWLVDGDHSYLNAPLSRLYGIEGVEGLEMRQVKLPRSDRGGLLGHASILTASANGIDTSPVVRGVWVLECLLGTPPSPPPPDIDPLEPDTRGATTIREQLSKHREIASCRHCHQRIDPLGFALEAFDEIGRFRTHYGSQQAWRNEPWIPVDSSGELPSGEAFADIGELKRLLVKQVPLIQRNLASKLMIQATGRTGDPNDSAEVLAICDDPRADGMGLGELILDVVASDAFRR